MCEFWWFSQKFMYKTLQKSFEIPTRLEKDDPKTLWTWILLEWNWKKEDQFIQNKNNVVSDHEAEMFWPFLCYIVFERTGTSARNQTRGTDPIVSECTPLLEQLSTTSLKISKTVVPYYVAENNSNSIRTDRTGAKQRMTNMTGFHLNISPYNFWIALGTVFPES